jgi:hypothetical protein
MNPKGGANMGHVIEQPDPNVNLLEQIFSEQRVNIHYTTTVW